MSEKTRKEKMKAEWEKIKPLSFSKKLGYIWDYYKLVLAAIAGILFLVCLVLQMIFRQDVVTELSVALINASPDNGAAYRMQDEFGQYAGLDGEGQEILMDHGYQMRVKSTDHMTIASQTKLMAAVSSSSMDVMIMSKDVFDFYLDTDLFVDLREVLSDDMELLTDRLILGAGEEETEEKPYGLDVSGSKKLSELYSNGPVVLAVPGNAPHIENIAKFVQYILL